MIETGYCRKIYRVARGCFRFFSSTLSQGQFNHILKERGGGKEGEGGLNTQGAIGWDTGTRVFVGFFLTEFVCGLCFVCIDIYFDELLRQIILEETDRDKVHQTFSGIWSGKLMNYCIFVYDLRYVSQKNITV